MAQFFCIPSIANLHQTKSYKSKNCTICSYPPSIFMARSRCEVCKYFRRSCPPDCIFAPYFPNENYLSKFKCLHRIYGASKLSKMLEEMPLQLRADGVESLCYEAECRIQDPVYGCVGIISSFHQQIQIAESQLAKTQAEISFLSANFVVDEPSTSRLGEPLVQQNGVDHGPDDPFNAWFIY